MRPLLFTCLLWLGGCGLFPAQGIDFREYPLRDVAYDNAVDIVRSVTQRYYAENFSLLGGFSLSWDEQAGNLKASPVTTGERRMTLYVSLEPRPWGTAVSMLALVEHLAQDALGGVAWVRPLQDVPLEGVLYRAYLTELVRRRKG